MIISDILNLINCGQAGVLGTGTKGCLAFFKNVTAIWLTPVSFKFDGSRDLDSTYINELITEGNLIVINRISSFTPNTPDDTMDELEDGTKDVANLGKYEFEAEFKKGMYFHAALHSYNSFGNYRTLFIDRDGNLMGTEDSDGSLKGFTTGYIQAKALSWASNSLSQREGLGFQLTERADIDERYLLVDSKNLTVSLNTIEGVNEVKLTYVSVPSDTGTDITIKAVLKQDGSVVTGVQFADWLHQINGVTAAVTAGDDSVLAGTYVLTVPALAAGETSTIDLFDSSGNNEVITLAGDLYKSEIVSAVVV